MKTARSWLIALIVLLPLPAAALDRVRVGVLQFGTVNWEMNVMQRHRFDRRHEVDIQVVPLGSKNALSVALQGGAVDVIVSDWIWVNRQRAAGRDYTFFPYSLAVGGVYVRPDAGIHEVADLAHHKLGIAGGPVDKSWLLLQAWGKAHDLDIAAAVEPTFAAPPLLNRLMLKGDLPAVLNYWHYGARLDAAGMQPLIDVSDMLKDLGIRQPVPMLGWVFSRHWAQAHPAALRSFLAATYEAKRRLGSDDAEWLAIRPLTHAEDEATLQRLRDGYRRGIPLWLVGNGEAAAAQLFDILAREGGEQLTGSARTLLPGTFWNGLDSAELSRRDAAG